MGMELHEPESSCSSHAEGLDIFRECGTEIAVQLSEASDSASSSECSEASQQERQEEGINSANLPTAMLIARYITNMKLASPEVLRATSPGFALRGFGWALRRPQTKDLFSRSWPVQYIQTFWSHSWHGKTAMKMLVLLLSYNGPAAVILGTLAAAVMFAFNSYGYLPAYSKAVVMLEGDELDEHQPMEYLDMAPWALGAGCIVSILVLFLWPAPGSIFVDRICIHQEDPDLKGKGIISIGGFIRYSRDMMVLWDSTYVERLWCIFELAAFLRSQDDDPSKRLCVRPTFLGPCVFALYVSWAVGCLTSFLLLDTSLVILIMWMFGFLVVLAVFGHALRSHQRSIHQMLHQLKEFRIENTKSQCCTMGHRNPHDQNPLTCDREILMQCIAEWFGNVEKFEEEVRSRVRIALEKGLGNAGMPYLWGIAAVCPFMWTQLDAIAGRLRAGRGDWAAKIAIYTVVAWLGIVPLVLPLAFTLTKQFRRRRRWIICDLGVTVMVTAAVVLFIVLLYLIYAGVAMLVPIRFLGPSIYAVVLSVVGFLTWRHQSWRFARWANEQIHEGHSACAPADDGDDAGKQ